tara:strand:+ start:14041 stop:15834 length:1794 start_codon:yes stop_codon:yes gene_type:complete
MAKRPINYTSRDFESIKQDLVNYAERYYPTTFKDFSEASFGALMMDMVAYVGDQLSFYADFQANESFLDSAITYENVNRLSNTLGYKTPGAAKSTGLASFYIIVPADPNSRGPDLDYFPILQRGSLISSKNGSAFTLTENVDFTNPNNEVTVARVDDSTGNPTFFAVKAFGQVVSGQVYEQITTVTDYERFLRINIDQGNISEVISVKDSQGNEYYEVDFLTQDVIIKEFQNTSSDREVVPYIMKLKPVPRRFVTQFEANGDTYIQFGYGSQDNITTDVVADPADVVLDVNGRTHITDQTFDPTNLIQTDKFGVVPTDTTLTIEYAANTSDEINVAVNGLSEVISPRFSFRNEGTLDLNSLNGVVTSIEVENENPILGDTSILTAEEIRERAFGTFASQNRAVTRVDYINLIYRMPSKFGKVKRANVVRDVNSLKRNLNVYLLSENANGDLIEPNTNLKENTRVWLNKYRMINDTVDVLSGKVINIGIKFKVLPALDVNRYELLDACIQKLKDEYINIKFNIGEAIYISQIYKLLNEVPGVVDTTEVELVNNVGGVYSNYRFDIDSNLSDDGRFLVLPEDAAAEVLLPNRDIIGAVI